MDRYNVAMVKKLKGNRLEICRAYRFYKVAETPEEVKAINLLSEYYKEVGGMTPEISKRIGWEATI